MIADLRLDEAPIDPLELTETEMVDEIQRVVKALLGYGARLPKELMLFTKNMLFVESSLAILAPELDILSEVETIAGVFAAKHGDALWADLGIRADSETVDLRAVKAGLGVGDSHEGLTYAELQERRSIIQQRFQKKASRGSSSEEANTQRDRGLRSCTVKSCR